MSRIPVTNFTCDMVVFAQAANKTYDNKWQVQMQTQTRAVVFED